MRFQCLLLTAAFAFAASQSPDHTENVVASVVLKAEAATTRCNVAAAEHEAALANTTALQKAIANYTAMVKVNEPEVAAAQEALSTSAGRVDKSQKVYDIVVAMADTKKALKASVFEAANADVAFDSASAKRVNAEALVSASEASNGGVGASNASKAMAVDFAREEQLAKNVAQRAQGMDKNLTSRLTGLQSQLDGINHPKVVTVTPPGNRPHEETSDPVATESTAEDDSGKEAVKATGAKVELIGEQQRAAKEGIAAAAVAKDAAATAAATTFAATLTDSANAQKATHAAEAEAVTSTGFSRKASAGSFLQLQQTGPSKEICESALAARNELDTVSTAVASKAAATKRADEEVLRKKAETVNSRKQSVALSTSVHQAQTYHLHLRNSAMNQMKKEFFISHLKKGTKQMNGLVNKATAKSAEMVQSCREKDAAADVAVALNKTLSEALKAAKNLLKERTHMVTAAIELKNATGEDQTKKPLAAQAPAKAAVTAAAEKAAIQAEKADLAQWLAARACVNATKTATELELAIVQQEESQQALEFAQEVSVPDQAYSDSKDKCDSAKLSYTNTAVSVLEFTAAGVTGRAAAHNITLEIEVLNVNISKLEAQHHDLEQAVDSVADAKEKTNAEEASAEVKKALDAVRDLVKQLESRLMAQNKVIDVAERNATVAEQQLTSLNDTAEALCDKVKPFVAAHERMVADKEFKAHRSAMRLFRIASDDRKVARADMVSACKVRDLTNRSLVAAKAVAVQAKEKAIRASEAVQLVETRLAGLKTAKKRDSDSALTAEAETDNETATENMQTLVLAAADAAKAAAKAEANATATATVCQDATTSFGSADEKYYVAQKNAGVSKPVDLLLVNAKKNVRRAGEALNASMFRAAKTCDQKNKIQIKFKKSVGAINDTERVLAAAEEKAYRVAGENSTDATEAVDQATEALAEAKAFSANMSTDLTELVRRCDVAMFDADVSRKENILAVDILNALESKMNHAEKDRDAAVKAAKAKVATAKDAKDVAIEAEFAANNTRQTAEEDLKDAQTQLASDANNTQLMAQVTEAKETSVAEDVKVVKAQETTVQATAAVITAQKALDAAKQASESANAPVPAHVAALEQHKQLQKELVVGDKACVDAHAALETATSNATQARAVKDSHASQQESMASAGSATKAELDDIGKQVKENTRSLQTADIAVAKATLVDSETCSEAAKLKERVAEASIKAERLEKEMHVVDNWELLESKYEPIMKKMLGAQTKELAILEKKVDSAERLYNNVADAAKYVKAQANLAHVGLEQSQKELEMESKRSNPDYKSIKDDQEFVSSKLDEFQVEDKNGKILAGMTGAKLVTMEDSKAQLTAFKALMGDENKMLETSEAGKIVKQMVRRSATSAEKKLIALHAHLVEHSAQESSLAAATDKNTALASKLADAKAKQSEVEAQVQTLDEACRAARKSVLVKSDETEEGLTTDQASEDLADQTAIFTAAQGKALEVTASVEKLQVMLEASIARLTAVQKSLPQLKDKHMQLRSTATTARSEALSKLSDACTASFFVGKNYTGVSRTFSNHASNPAKFANSLESNENAACPGGECAFGFDASLVTSKFGSLKVTMGCGVKITDQPSFAGQQTSLYASTPTFSKTWSSMVTSVEVESNQFSLSKAIGPLM